MSIQGVKVIFSSLKKLGVPWYRLAGLVIGGMQWEVSYHYNLWGQFLSGNTISKLQAVGLLATEEVTVA